MNTTFKGNHWLVNNSRNKFANYHISRITRSIMTSENLLDSTLRNNNPFNKLLVKLSRCKCFTYQRKNKHKLHKFRQWVYNFIIRGSLEWLLLKCSFGLFNATLYCILMLASQIGFNPPRRKWWRQVSSLEQLSIFSLF